MRVHSPRLVSQYNAKFDTTDDGKEAYADGTFGARRANRAETREEAGWDSSTWRYVPHALKGIKPVTNEPWARDEAVYNESRNSVDFRNSIEFTPTEHFSFANGADDGEAQWNASIKPPDGAMAAYPA